MKAALRVLWRPRSVSAAIGWMVGIVAMTIADTAGTAVAETIAYWHFNNLPAGDAPLFMTADVGLGEINVAGYTNPDDVNIVAAGTTINALPGVVAGNSMSFSGPGPHVGSPVYIFFSMTGYENLHVSFAARRATNSVFFTGSEWAWATGDDPGNFTVIPGTDTLASGTAFELEQLSLSSITQLNNSATVILRHVWTASSGGPGAQRWDNILISGTAIPAPGAIALLGVAGFVGSRRRRP